MPLPNALNPFHVLLPACLQALVASLDPLHMRVADIMMYPSAVQHSRHICVEPLACAPPCLPAGAGLIAAR
jgi:hypothetical protein